MVAGATATGKTSLSLELAERLVGEGIGIEIMSADSRQVYRGLDIGTAKVTQAERARVAHHGLDLVEPDEVFSIADFTAHATAALAAIAERAAATGRPPLALLVGGSGLYLRAVARGLPIDALPSDERVRAAVEALVWTAPANAVAELRERAPTLAAAIDLRNPRRVARGLEIARLAGDVARPLPRGYPGPSTWIGLSVEPAEHRTRIADRARAQFAAGLLDEAGGLRRRFDPGLPAFSAIGYREAWSVLDGERDLDAAIELDAARNVAFARRQRTWFRAEPGIAWLSAGTAIEVGTALEAARTAAHALVDEATRRA